MKKLILILAISLATHTFAQPNNVPPSGPVTIGTTTSCPGKQLTVNGHARFYNDAHISGTLIGAGDAVLQGDVRMDSLVNYTGTPDDLSIIVIDPMGNITRTPKSDFVAMLLEPIGVDYCGTGDVSNPQWYKGLNKLFSPCPQVNVGIGNSNPEFKLDVTGETFTVKLLVGNSLGTDTAMINAYAFNHTQRLLQLGKKVGGLAEEIRFVVNNDGSTELTNVGSNPALTINNGTSHAIVINDNSGNKIAQLENTGLLRSRSIRVDLSTWADHVFEDEYDLMDLKDVKRFIAENGHLPDVPSEKEIETNGLDLGEMQRIQMQKIEELTLHLIQMDEKMTEMQNDMEALKQENKTLKSQLK